MYHDFSINNKTHDSLFFLISYNVFDSSHKKNKMSFLHRQQLFCLHAVRNALKMKCSYCKWLLHKTFGGGKFRTLYQFQNC